MSLSGIGVESPEFRPEFVEQIVGFFGDQFDALGQKERAHSVGVVANTLAALAVNQARAINADGMSMTLATLGNSTNEIIENFVNDESVTYLFPQSLRICEIIQGAIAKREQ